MSRNNRNDANGHPTMGDETASNTVGEAYGLYMQGPGGMSEDLCQAVYKSE